MPKQKFNVFRDGKIHVCKSMCSTCIFRPGNLMHLLPGTVETMVAESVKDEASIPCHKTLDGDNAVCHGFFTKHPTLPIRLAKSMNLIEYVEVQ
jgi:hypothetical protein